MTPEQLLEWMERLQEDLLRFLRAFGFQYDLEDVLQEIRLKLVGMGEDGSLANPPPCTTYRGDLDNRDHVFRWLCSWAKNEARNAQRQAWSRREVALVEERKPGASRKRGGVRELLDAAAAEDGPPALDEMDPNPPPDIPPDQVRASLREFKDLGDQVHACAGPAEGIEDDPDPWTLLTDIELDLDAADEGTGPRRRGRPVKWDDSETRRVFADFLHIRRALRHAAKEYARRPEEPEQVYCGRLSKFVLEFDQWLREWGPISYRAKPDPNHMGPPGYQIFGRYLVPVWPPLTQADARRIAWRSQGHETALTVQFVAHCNGARPDQIRGVLDGARKLAVSRAPSLARTGGTTPARR